MIHWDRPLTFSRNPEWDVISHPVTDRTTDSHMHAMYRLVLRNALFLLIQTLEVAPTMWGLNIPAITPPSWNHSDIGHFEDLMALNCYKKGMWTDLNTPNFFLPSRSEEREATQRRLILFILNQKFCTWLTVHLRLTCPETLSSRLHDHIRLKNAWYHLQVLHL